MEKLATRSVPGTRFRDTGSFDVRGETVKILCRAYNHNDVCWVECEVRPCANVAVYLCSLSIQAAKTLSTVSRQAGVDGAKLLKGFWIQVDFCHGCFQLLKKRIIADWNIAPFLG